MERPLIRDIVFSASLMIWIAEISLSVRIVKFSSFSKRQFENWNLFPR